MQYPVPQFTDVEDKIIGPLTLKQAGIIGGAGFLVFFLYSTTKSVPLLVTSIIFLGLPAAGIAFAKFNGRPVYNNFIPIFKYLLNPKQLMFHKEGASLGSDATVEKFKAENPETEITRENSSAKLKKLNYALQQQAREQEELLNPRGY
jgi:hypothetical protein